MIILIWPNKCDYYVHFYHGNADIVSHLRKGNITVLLQMAEVPAAVVPEEHVNQLYVFLLPPVG